MNYTIVIDYQKDFIDGSLFNQDAINIRDNVISRIKEGIKNNNKLIFTRDTHQENYLETNEGRHLPVKHCIENTPGHEIDKIVYDEFKIYPHEIINKPTFGYKDWNLENPQNIYMLGVCTDICVISNALILKALYPNANVYVYENACAGLSKEKHNAALDVMRSCQIQVI